MATQDEQEKLNAALDAALDELDDDDDDEIFQDTISSPDDNDPLAPFSQNQSTSRSPLISEPSPPKIKATTPSSAFIGPPRPPSSQQSDMTPEKFLEDMMKELSNVDSDAGMGDLMGRFLQEMQAQIKSEIDQLETGNASASSPVKSSNGNSASRQNMSATTTASPGKEEVDAVISNLVDDMTKKATIDQKELKRQSMATVSEDEMLNSIMEGFAHLGSGDDVAEDFDADAVIDGMMEHLLSKDLMYEPIKQVATRFPSWLEEKRGVLSHKEYAEREKQCLCFQRLVQVYEKEPDNVTRLMDLMQEVQEYGQPPTEIIQEIAPGIELDAEGMPKLDGSNLPFPPNEECCIT